MADGLSLKKPSNLIHIIRDVSEKVHFLLYDSKKESQLVQKPQKKYCHIPTFNIEKTIKKTIKEKKNGTRYP